VIEDGPVVRVLAILDREGPIVESAWALYGVTRVRTATKIMMSISRYDLSDPWMHFRTGADSFMRQALAIQHGAELGAGRRLSHNAFVLRGQRKHRAYEFYRERIVFDPESWRRIPVDEK
jgi:hypothetical protein